VITLKSDRPVGGEESKGMSPSYIQLYIHRKSMHIAERSNLSFCHCYTLSMLFALCLSIFRFTLISKRHSVYGMDVKSGSIVFWNIFPHSFIYRCPNFMNNVTSFSS